jgi:hypothetical protein
MITINKILLTEYSEGLKAKLRQIKQLQQEDEKLKKLFHRVASSKKQILNNNQWDIIFQTKTRTSSDNDTSKHYQTNH